MLGRLGSHSDGSNWHRAFPCTRYCSIHRSRSVCLSHGWEHFHQYIYGSIDANSASALFAKLHRQTSSHLLGSESSFGKLFALSSATLAQGAVNYGLHLSILLNGARGIGKFTVATWVAQRLGMHYLEVNIPHGL
jgi:peroxin-6